MTRATLNRTLFGPVLIMVLLAFSQHGHAKLIKCWENDVGIRECGSTVPPEYSQKRIEVVNERGLVVRVIEAAKTPEQLAREREQEYLRKQQEAARREQARLDAILLNAYTTERDLLLARDNNVKAAQGQIDISRSNLKLLENNLADLESRAANYERTGKEPPQSLIDEISQLKVQISGKSENVARQEDDLQRLKSRFDSDLKRFRQLKKGRVN